MTEKTDEIARNVALNRIADTLWNTDGVYDSYGAAGKVAFGHTVTWERDVNEHGQPVRRYVLRGQWETDPEAVRSGSQTCPECDGWASDQFALGVHRQLMHPEAVDRDRRS